MINLIILFLPLIYSETTMELLDNDITLYTHVFRLPGYEPETRRLNHFWGDYRWRKTSEQLVITVSDCSNDNMTKGWKWNTIFRQVIDGWNNVPEFQNGGGRIFKPANASMEIVSCPNGMIRFYNENVDDTYLGIARLYARGNNIIRVDSYVNEFHLYKFNQNQWKSVVCHEIGHGWPLGHPDTSGRDLDTCMDYSSALDNTYGNYKDVQLIDYLYANKSLNPYEDDTYVDYTRVLIVIVFIMGGSLLVWGLNLLCCPKQTVVRNNFIQEEPPQPQPRIRREGEAGAMV